MKKQAELDLDAYPFTVRKLAPEEGGGYLVEYPDVPLCQSDGETVEEAIANGRDALEGSLMCYLQDGKPLPKPSSGRAYSGTFRVHMSKTMHAQLSARAQEEGVSLNLFAAEAAAKAAGKYEGRVRIGLRRGKRATPARRENVRTDARKIAMRHKRAKRVKADRCSPAGVDTLALHRSSQPSSL